MSVPDMVELERERLRIERAKLAIMALQYELNRRALRAANKSWVDKLDDLLFG